MRFLMGNHQVQLQYDGSSMTRDALSILKFSQLGRHH